MDKGSHLIADYEVTNNCNDQGLLKEVADSTRKMLETETLEIVADKGYESREDILNCVMNKCTSSKNHKTVSFGPETKYVPVKM